MCGNYIDKVAVFLEISLFEVPNGVLEGKMLVNQGRWRIACC